MVQKRAKAAQQPSMSDAKRDDRFRVRSCVARPTRESTW
jgi:hypothetical protein